MAEHDVSGWSEPDNFGVYLYAVEGAHARCDPWCYLATSAEEAIALWRADERRQHEPSGPPGGVQLFDLAVSASAQKLLATVFAKSSLDPEEIKALVRDLGNACV